MNDVEELLGKAARSVEVGPSAETIESDVRRARVVFARRRRRRAIASSAVGTLAVSALVGGVLVASNVAGPNGPSAGPNITDPAQVTSPERKSPAEGIRLVAYEGKQLDGFVVDRVPEGWFLQGSTTVALTIAPDGDDTHPAAFVGKLVVLLASADAPQELPDDGVPVEVGDNPGVVTRTGGGNVATLHYKDDDENYVNVQAYMGVLGWTNQQLADFAEGVTVTGDAEASRG